MIYVPLLGGLGNQMFVYAYYQYLISKGYGARLFYGEFLFTSQHYGVEIFRAFPYLNELVPPKVGFYLSVNRFVKNKPILREGLRIAIRLYYRTFRMYRQENAYSFDSFDSFDFKRNRAIVNGSWQNVKYLEPIEDTVRKYFIFNTSNLAETNILSKIQEGESVSIHVRRGDYLNPEYSSLNVIKSAQYYFNCISLIKSKYDKLHFFVFSDDIDWCKKVFVGEDYTFVACNVGDNSYLDMYYMSQCKHNIISNSTFSWWAAWLNPNKSKEVYAPLFWTTAGDKSSDFCPRSWNFIDTSEV